MARPTKLARAKRRVMRLQLMLREAEDIQQALEAKEEDPVNTSMRRLSELEARVEVANNCQLQREMGRINIFDPCGDIEAMMRAMRHRLRVDSGF